MKNLTSTPLFHPTAASQTLQPVLMVGPQLSVISEFSCVATCCCVLLCAVVVVVFVCYFVLLYAVVIVIVCCCMYVVYLKRLRVVFRCAKAGCGRRLISS